MGMVVVEINTYCKTPRETAKYPIPHFTFRISTNRTPKKPGGDLSTSVWCANDGKPSRYRAHLCGVSHN